MRSGAASGPGWSMSGGRCSRDPPHAAANAGGDDLHGPAEAVQPVQGSERADGVSSRRERVTGLVQGMPEGPHPKRQLLRAPDAGSPRPAAGGCVRDLQRQAPVQLRLLGPDATDVSLQNPIPSPQPPPATSLHPHGPQVGVTRAAAWGNAALLAHPDQGGSHLAVAASRDVSPPSLPFSSLSRLSHRAPACPPSSSPHPQVASPRS
jgi:hypothetical protein